MNNEADMGTLDRAGSEHDFDSGAEQGTARGAKCASPHRPQRWAWTAAGGHYDWMDAHGPIASLD